MKLTVVTAKQPNLVSINDLKNRIQMNTKNLPGIAIVKRMKCLNTVKTQITTLAVISRKLLIGKAD